MIMRHFIEALINPFFLFFIVFVIVGYRLHRQQSLSKKCSITWFLMIIALFLASTGWLPHYLISHLENHYAVVNNYNLTIRWIVVLSGGQANVAHKPPHDLLYNASIKRLIEGVRLYRHLPRAKLVLSGGGYGGDIPEAQHLKEIAQWLAISSQDIVLENYSLNTQEQAMALKKLVDNAPFYLVTSASHMSRAMALCQAQKLKPIAAPTDFTYYWNDEIWEKTYIPNAHNLVYLKIALHEWLGKLWSIVQKH